MTNWVVHNALAIQVGAKGKPEQLAKLISQLGPTWNFAESERDRAHQRTMEQHGDSGVIYSFTTTYSNSYSDAKVYKPAIPAILSVSSQYPELFFSLFYEEETGWGGQLDLLGGSVVRELDYQNKCEECDSINTLEWCENDCGQICSACEHVGEFAGDMVWMCDTHKANLDDNDQCLHCQP